MNKKYTNLIFCLLSLGILLGCGQTVKIQPTSTPEPTYTTVPTSTPVRAATVLPGWIKFEGDGIEIWLPETYVGGNLEENLDLIVERLRNLGPDFEQMAQIIEQNPSMYTIWALDSVIGDSGFMTNVCVIKEEVLSAVTIDMYLDATIKQLPAQFQLEKREIGTLGNYQAGYMILNAEINGQKIKELLYTVKNDNTMYVVTFATGASEFEQRSAEFEQIMQTFTIQP